MEENIINPEESITGEEINLAEFDEASAKKIRDLHAGFTRKTQEFSKKEREYLQQLNELREIEKEYRELLAFEPFIEWAKNYREKTNNRDEYEDYDEEDTVKEELMSRIENVEKSLMVENIRAEIEEINDEVEKSGFPKIEGKIFDTMLSIAKDKANRSPDGRCNLTVRELYHLAIKDEIPYLLKKDNVPFFETTSARGGDTKAGTLFDSILEASKRRTI